MSGLFAASKVRAVPGHGWTGLLLVLLSPFANPQVAHGHQDTVSARIDGRVISRSGDPIAAVEVTVIGGDVGALTDSAGWFRLIQVSPGVSVLRLRRIGFKAQYLRLNLEPRTSQTIQVMLDPGPQVLPDITVTAKEAKPVEFAWTTKYDDFFRRRTLGLPGGTFISADDLRRRPASHTAELIEQYVPGARVYVHFLGPGGTEIKFPRCSGGYVGVWIDGRKINWQPDYQAAIPLIDLSGRGEPTTGQAAARKRATELADVLDAISPLQIQFMEVYRGIGSIPGEFSGGCGAIAIWTK